jgi:chromosome segregation ATPase
MNSLIDMRRLLHFSSSRQLRYQQALRRTETQLQPLLARCTSLDEHQSSLHSLLDSHRAQTCVMDRAELYALLRRQAVIRRQIHEVRLERDRLEQQCLELRQTLHEQREQLRQLQRKHEKFQGCARQLLRGQRLENLRREEREIEDMAGVRR